MKEKSDKALENPVPLWAKESSDCQLHALPIWYGLIAVMVTFGQQEIILLVSVTGRDGTEKQEATLIARKTYA